MRIFLTIADDKETALELLAAGGTLASQGDVVAAVAPAEGTWDAALFEHGADTVYRLPARPAGVPWESAVPILAELIASAKADFVLVGASPRGKETAARLAALAGAGLVTECSALRMNDAGQLETERYVLGGAAVASDTVLSVPAMATIPPRSIEKRPAEPGRTGAVQKIDGAYDLRVLIRDTAPAAHGAVDIAAAQVVVAVGRGVAEEADLAIARELAAAAGGEIGCTRAIAEDFGWLPPEQYIGLSGKKIRPGLYIGMGISGQVQHVAGIRDSKIIVAVNKDEKAPIFQASDYGAVGDLYEIIPALTAEIRRLRQV